MKLSWIVALILSFGLLFEPGYAVAKNNVNVKLVTQDQITYMNAVEHDRAEIVQKLLEKGFDPNVPVRENEPALVRAIRMSSKAVVQVLLTAKNLNIDAETEYGENALMLAAYAGDVNLVKTIVKMGAKVDKRLGWTPLMYAAANGYDEIVRYLISKGANVNTRNESGITALYMAARKPSREVVMTLLRAGAYRDLCNTSGESPADAAGKVADDQELAKYLAIDRCVEPFGSPFRKD